MQQLKKINDNYKGFGRRKSWIVPIQTILGLLMYWLGANLNFWLDQVFFFFLFFSFFFSKLM